MPLQGMNGLIVQREPLVAVDLKAALEAVGAHAKCSSSADSAVMEVVSGDVQFCILDDRLWWDDDAADVASLLCLTKIPFVVFGTTSRNLTGSFANVQKPSPSDDVVAMLKRHFAHQAKVARVPSLNH